MAHHSTSTGGPGYALVGALAVRAWIGTQAMSVCAPGLIAGDGLAGFGDAIVCAL